MSVLPFVCMMVLIVIAVHVMILFVRFCAGEVSRRRVEGWFVALLVLTLVSWVLVNNTTGG